ncbi:MAG: YibE/F family protein [Acidimicrobiales bacterium]|nr:YibE/F family protein [Acidimicrobiales bacterium]MCB1014419.1 YibE/F family protein [Acidimicrobiales bacterium]MCB9373852.1 YibE/F family protein [Microthrixaceae bacterium]
MDGHHHHAASGPSPAQVRRGLNWLVGGVAALTLIGVVVLWPRGAGPDLRASTQGLVYVDATVTAVDSQSCTDVDEQLETECQAVTVRLTSGPRDNDLATFLSSQIDFSAPTFEPGDEVVLLYNDLAPEEFQFSFVEYQRSSPLLWLTVVFVLVVLVVARWMGLRALIGLGLSLAVIVTFLLPALLREENPLAVALVTTTVIAFAALYIAHGIRPATTVALVGTLVSVVVITLGAALLAGAAELTGLSDENVQTLRVTASALDLRGIVIAGMVIGALGVLDDVTVTQVSAVQELRGADPTMPGRTLYRRAMRIGRDHIASTINTLVLAYTGASLALLLFLEQEGRQLGRVLTREVIAVEIVRALVGSIGLVLSVPITTALAVVTLTPGDTVVEPRRTGDAAHDDGGPGDGGAGDSSPSPAWDDFAPRDDPER